jgi:hypothetical protein
VSPGPHVTTFATRKVRTRMTTIEMSLLSTAMTIRLGERTGRAVL